jgi:hypothetical protein
VGRIVDVEVPVFAIGTWTDGYFRSGTLRLIEEGLQQTWAFYGPWPHGAPISYDDPPDPQLLPAGLLLAWFDRWVRDDERAPVPARPTFASFELPAGAGTGWRLLPEWVPSGQDAVTWHLGVDGTLAHDAPEGVVTLEQPREPDDEHGACTFTSTPLETDRVLVGWTVLAFDAVLSAPDAHFYVELLDVAPGGEATVVNDGFLKASHRHSHVAPEPVPPGGSERFEIRVRATHWRFVAGHRVAVRISAGGRDRLEPVTDAVRVEIRTGPTATLSLPGFAAR